MDSVSENTRTCDMMGREKYECPRTEEDSLAVYMHCVCDEIVGIRGLLR